MEFKKTITSIFIMPTLGIKREDLVNNGFINAFIKDNDASVIHEGCVFLVFKPTNFTRFREFLDSEYERTGQIIEDYDYDKGFVVVVYKLDNTLTDDFTLVKLGKYSKTSQKFQALFPKVIKMMKGGLHRDEISLQYRVFNRTRDLIEHWENEFNVSIGDEQELWRAFVSEEEELTITKIKEYV